jgi:hypothetical protein
MYHFGMKSAEQLLALINDANGLTLTLDDISFELPVALIPEEQEDLANTEILIKSKPNRKQEGDVTVRYDRINLADFETVADPHGIPVDTPVTHASLLAGFNEFYGAALELVDIDQTTELPDNLDQDEVVVLRSSAESLAYRGEIELLIESAGLDLAVVITNKNLNGLVLRFASAQPA